VPLLDHFHPPLSRRLPFTTLHAGWAVRIADDLNERWLAPNFLAAEIATSAAHPEIDIATYEELSPPAPGNGRAVSTMAAPTWTAPAPSLTAAVVFPPSFEVRIHTATEGFTLVAVIELVSPANKDRPGERQAFAAKCAAYIERGVSVTVIDIVTSKHFNLHNELVT
jgi:hypothetical protein